MEHNTCTTRKKKKKSRVTLGKIDYEMAKDKNKPCGFVFSGTRPFR